MSTSVRGHFLWHELLTSNPEAAKTFYRKVVGWNPAPSKDPSYIEWMAGKVPMGGLMMIPAEVKAMGVPPHWATYIGTDDVDATLRQAQSLGARVLKDVMSVPEVGRFAVVQDPQGAVFTAFTPSTGAIPTYPTPVGGFSWNELATTDWQAGWAFYSALFGWEKGQGMDMGPMGIYQIFQWKGTMLGAMFNKPPEIPVPNWLPYARVKSTTTAAAAVKAAGGQVINGPMDVPGGSIVQLLDPQGAVFAVHAVVDAPAVAKPGPKKPAPARPKKAKAVKKPAPKTAKKSVKKSAKKRGPTKAAKKGSTKKPAKKVASRARRRGRR